MMSVGRVHVKVAGDERGRGRAVDDVAEADHHPAGEERDALRPRMPVRRYDRAGGEFDPQREDAGLGLIAFDHGDLRPLWHRRRSGLPVDGLRVDLNGAGWRGGEEKQGKANDQHRSNGTTKTPPEAARTRAAA